jgi:hypothetical protein
MKDEGTRAQHRILNAAMSMVYGAGIVGKLTPEKASAITLDRVADYMEELVIRVREAGDSARANDEALTSLRSQRRIVGEFLRDAMKAAQ